MEETDAKSPTYWLTYKANTKIGHIVITYGEGISLGYGYDSLPFTKKKELIQYANKNGFTLEDAEYKQ